MSENDHPSRPRIVGVATEPSKMIAVTPNEAKILTARRRYLEARDIFLRLEADVRAMDKELMAARNAALAAEVELRAQLGLEVAQ